VRTLAAAREVASILDGLGIESALIGAMALAAHHYIRHTEDVDLATAVDPFSALSAAADRLRSSGYEVELNAPDAQDPLGGVLNVDRDGIDRIQVVNYFNPYNQLAPVGQEAVRTAAVVPGDTLRVVDLPHLIALKLYAGGRKSQLDVLELLERNPEVSREEIRQVCARFGLDGALAKLLDSLG
jgi:hypothetical protein